MKLKIKAFAATTLALAVAGTAQADIADFTSGNGELFFSIRDNTAQTSLVFDLNINMDDFLPGNAPAFQQFVNADVQNFVSSGSGDYSWSVMAGDNNPSNIVGGIRYLSTVNQSAEPFALTNGQLQAFTGMETSYLFNVNASLPGTTADGGTASFVVGDSGYFDTAKDTWNGNATFSSSASLGESQSFYLLSNSASLILAPNRGQQATQEKYATATWTLDATGVLTYQAVPLPPAVWLLGSALLGLVGVARRKTQGA